MSKDYNITEAEYEVMNIIWENTPIKGRDVVNLLQQKKDWKDSTIFTLIRRLVQKGVIKSKTEQKCFVYYPLISKEACMESEGKSFVNRFFDGAFTPMLAHFAESVSLSQKDIDQLKKVLEKQSEKG